MPPGHMYFPGPDGAVLITPRALINNEANVFDKAFNGTMEIEEWNDWMRWDGPAVEFDSPMLERKGSSTSTLSAYESSPAELGISAHSSYSTENEFTLEDAPFELDEPTQSCHDLTIAPSFPAASQPPLDLRRSPRGYSALTAAEEQSLQDIAMPYRVVSQIKTSSEPPSPVFSTSTQSQSPSPEPETRTRKNKKRKSIVDGEEVPNSLCQSRKRGHNAIEKRYRTNLNDKINCLRQGIPPLWRRSSSDSKSGDQGAESEAESDSKPGQQKYGKAAILTRALEYIQHLESTTERLGNEVAVLTTRVGAFEKLAMRGSIIMNGAPAPAPVEPTTVIKKETLESIQAEFKQIKRKDRSFSGPASRKDSKKGKQ